MTAVSKLWEDRSDGEHTCTLIPSNPDGQLLGLLPMGGM